MTFEERVEAAHAALDKWFPNHGLSSVLAEHVCANILVAAFPDLYIGDPPTAWLAPHEASEEMQNAGKRAMETDDLEPTHTEVATGYAAMRQAHLHPEKSP